MTDVFISYARPQRTIVDRIAETLRDLELVVWFDRELTPGEEFPAEIERHARNCKAMIVCWTPDAIKSSWVLREAEIARTRGVLVPVFLEKCTPPPPFHTIQTIDLVGWSYQVGDARFDSDLLERLQTLAGNPGPGKNGLRNERNSILNGRRNELVTRVRRDLIRLAKARETTSYGLMADRINVDQPTLWAALDAGAEENRSRREPPLCALVISDRTMRPGKGYFQKHAFLRDDFDPLATQLWESHRDWVWAYQWEDD